MNKSHSENSSAGATNKRQATDTYLYRNREVRIPAGYIAVGLIIGVHGLKGEVRVELHTDYPERFSSGAILWLGDQPQKVVIEQARPHKGFVLLQLQGITKREMAESLRGRWLLIDENEAAELEHDSYWVHDIVGLTVYTTDGNILGEVQDVLFTGANEVYIVAPAEGVNKGRELLIPAIGEVIQVVDLDSGTMTIALPPGLVEN